MASSKIYCLFLALGQVLICGLSFRWEDGTLNFIQYWIMLIPFFGGDLIEETKQRGGGEHKREKEVQRMEMNCDF